MMQDIKFRAWHEENKKMYAVAKIDMWGDPDQATCDLVNWEDEQLFDIYISEVKFMQYTGLKDKNGKEIYEGDILSRDFYWGWYVGFEDGGFRRFPCNMIQRINWEHYNLEQEGLEYWKIVGNIYENPELLKEDE